VCEHPLEGAIPSVKVRQQKERRAPEGTTEWTRKVGQKTEPAAAPDRTRKPPGH